MCVAVERVGPMHKRYNSRSQAASSVGEVTVATRQCISEAAV